jgi:8-oxo-dGTP pyrophosphatase MutT (NUDIX family)
VYREFELPPAVRLSLDPAADQVRVRDASTVLLVRDVVAANSPCPDREASGVEVFAFRRVRGMAFAAGMLVFPGGSLDPQDLSERLPWRNLPPGSTATPGAPGDLVSGVVAAAVRETFEECGVLLAVPDQGAVQEPGAVQDRGAVPGRSGPPAELTALREAMVDGRATLADVLRHSGLALDAGLLHPWARWVTPPGETRRFDTRFYLARVPAGQDALDLGGEGEAAGWLGAREALVRHAAGELPMLPPTQVALEELAQAGSVTELLATARPVPVVRPDVVEVERPGGSTVRVLRVALGGGTGSDRSPA